MKIVKSFIIFCLLGLAGTLTANVAAKEIFPKTIKVLLHKNITEALLEAKGGYNVFDPKDGTKISSNMGGKRYVVRATNTGIKWGEEFIGVHQLYIVPKDKSEGLLVDGVHYDGNIMVFKAAGKLNIVNDVNIDEYLKSSLSVQFPDPLENEVMSAIAIAARTTACSQVERNKEALWHVEAQDQGYNGIAMVQLDSHVCKAVEKTSNLILVNAKENEAPFMALWTDHCAGKTAAYHNIFRKDLLAPKKGVEAPHASLDKEKSKWNYSIAKEEVAKIFDLSDLKEIKLFVDNESNKTYAVKLTGSSDSKDVDFITFQKMLGKEHILSNDLVVKAAGDKLNFTGFGKGFGVGLCIYSASAMAENGDSAAKILSKFFPDTYILNLTSFPNEGKSVR
ncbi:MAG: SpoIID/LytB domain-containing protein [Chlamydiae bacterium]|nr:SpoIID/LytB domain-containing protein [Chlamydiota bacterium]